MEGPGLVLLRCSGCREERLFERIPCLDGHDDDCPDVICTECGSVVELGLAPFDAPAPLDVRSAA